MAAQPEEIAFVVPGQRTAAAPAAAALKGTVKSAVRVGARRAAGEVVRMTAQPGEDVVVLHIANGPMLCLHPDNARELMQAQATAGSPTARGGDGAPPLDREVVVPAQLSWRPLETPHAIP